MEQCDSGYCIFEDFLMLRQIFSNDLELNQVPTGGTVQSAEETADVIIDSSIKDTGWDRKPIVDVKRKNPALEFEKSCFPRYFPNIFSSGDGAFDQPHPLSLKYSQNESTCQKKRNIYNLAMQKGIGDKSDFLFTLYKTLPRQDARKATNNILRDVDLTTVNLPTRQDLQNPLFTYFPQIHLKKYTFFVHCGWWKYWNSVLCGWKDYIQSLQMLKIDSQGSSNFSPGLKKFQKFREK